MKKIFVDIYLMFNLGDDLFLDILAKKYPDCEFTINYFGNKYNQFLSQYGNVNKRKYTIINKIGQKLRISNSITNYNKVAEIHDALLFIGGSIFREEEYHETLYSDRLELVKEFKNKNKPVFILGANFGPFRTKEFLNDYKELFQLCDDICFRDRYSYDLFKKLPQVRYAPDIVFQKDIDSFKCPYKNWVGFSIIDVRHKHGLSGYYNSYITNTVKAIELLTKKGYECYLMSFCENEGDLGVINTIKSELPEETLKNVYTYSYKGNIDEAFKLIASCNLMFAARFHANIIAMLLGIGVMPIIYSKKTVNLLKDIKLDEVQIGMENLHLQHDEGILNKAFNNKIDLHSVTNQAKDQFKKMDEFLGVYSTPLISF